MLSIGSSQSPITGMPSATYAIASMSHNLPNRAADSVCSLPATNAFPHRVLRTESSSRLVDSTRCCMARFCSWMLFAELVDQIVVRFLLLIPSVVTVEAVGVCYQFLPLSWAAVKLKYLLGEIVSVAWVGIENH